MRSLSSIPNVKPILRGHFHQSAFFIAVGACAMLIGKSNGLQAKIATIVYSLTLIGLFGISALYHRPQWAERARAWMRRLDHSAIFLLIAGTTTPVCLLGLHGAAGTRLLVISWIAAALGVSQSLLWVNAPKWLTALLYIAVGWIAISFVSEINSSLGLTSAILIVAGGAVYTLGAIIYALKRPNPFPRVFGYHEIFHLLVDVAAIFHFVAIARLLN
jgi:hemolysin III